MNIDQRLERLTERHEALALSVELIAVQVAETAKTMDRVVASIDSLVNIAREHEGRLHRLEGGETA